MMSPMMLFCSMSCFSLVEGSKQVGSGSSTKLEADSEIVVVDLAFWDDLFEQHRSRNDFGMTISGI